MAVRILMGKKKKSRNGYSLHEYTGDGTGYKEEYSDDEDDVFVEDASLDGLANASKPLMHPRQRTKVKSRRPECKCRSLCKPVLYFLLMVGLLGGLISLLLYVLSRHKSGVLSEPSFLNSKMGGGGGVGAVKGGTVDLIGCDNVEVEDVWVVGFPKLLTESAFRLVDVNEDGVLDVILGFATGADGFGIPPVVCDIYFNGTNPCYGGVLALEGASGRELWRHYSLHEIFALNCNVDLDGDKVPDCLAAGRAAVFEAVSGRDGKLLWNFGPQESKNEIMNVYTPTYITDIDNDNVPDFVVAHGGDPLADPGSAHRLSGRLLVVSGRTGQVLSWTGVPDQRESYYSTQIYPQMDATPMVLFGTGGETHGGSLWVIALDHLTKGRSDMARAIYTDKFKGVMTPPVLLDLTGDSVLDIVIAPFNSCVIAIDGHTYDVLWNYTLPMSETYSTPAAGYYNDDDVPDFLVKFAVGPGFPVYYYSQTTVLDGKTGKPLLQTPIKDSVGSQASGITISMEGKGHDLFLYWIADCLEHEGEGGEYQFVEGTNVHEMSRSDFCRLRYKTAGFSKLMAIGRALKNGGATVYFSEDRKERERQDWVNTTAEALEFLRNHPEHLRMYERYNARARAVEAGLSSSSPSRPPFGRRKGALPNPPPSQEGYNEQYGSLPTGDHSLGAKKGPQLSPQRGGNQSPPRQYQQQPSWRPQQKQQQQRQQQGSRQRQYDKYDLNPFASDDNSPYSMEDLAESLYPRRGQSNADQDDRDMFGGYPYGTGGQQDEYSRYYPDTYANERYGNGAGSYDNRYQPYGNYFQKREYSREQDMNSPLGSGRFSDYGDEDPRDILLKLADEASSGGSDSESGYSGAVHGGHALPATSRALPKQGSENRRKPSQKQHRQNSQKVKSNGVLQQKPAQLLKTQQRHSGQVNNADTLPQNARSSGHQAPSAKTGKGVLRESAVDVRSETAQPEHSRKAEHSQNLSRQTPRSSLAGRGRGLPGSVASDAEISGVKTALLHHGQPSRDSKQASADSQHSASSTRPAGSDVVADVDFENKAHKSVKQSKHGSDNAKTNKKKRNNFSKKEPASKPIFMKRKRKRRHVGPHDDKGLQRLLSTGTIAPSTLPPDHPDYGHTVDVVFATYWFFPAKTQAILPGDQKCIADKLSKEEQRFDPKNKYYGMDHDAYEHAVTHECLQASSHQLSDDGVYESQTAFNPYNIHMGQMTVYRLRIKCTCSKVTNTTEDKRCAKMLSFDKQQWPAYMGRNGDSYWLPRT